MTKVIELFEAICSIKEGKASDFLIDEQIANRLMGEQGYFCAPGTSQANATWIRWNENEEIERITLGKLGGFFSLQKMLEAFKVV